MPRRKRNDQISATHLAEIDRQMRQLRAAMREAQIDLTPFRAHYDALMQLDNDLHVALNRLTDRPDDYREPHGGHGG